MRDPANPSHYLVARSVQPPFVTRADIIEVDADSNRVGKDAPHVPIERYIHGKIYRLRPDVNSVVQSHARGGLPFTVVQSMPLRAICHSCSFIGHAAPIFEIRDTAGNGSNMLVQTRALGAALGKNNLVLMRGHGFAVMGSNVKPSTTQSTRC